MAARATASQPLAACRCWCGNWLCLAEAFTRPIRHNSFSHQVVSLPAARGAIGFVSHECPGSAVLPALAGRCLFRPVWGKLGSFGAIRPSDGSVGVFAGPRRLRPCRQIGFVCTSSPNDGSAGDLARPHPLLSMGEIGFVSHAFVRSPAFTRDRTGLFRLKAVLRTVHDRLRDRCCLWGKFSTMAHAGPLTTKPSKVVVSLSVLRYSVAGLSYECPQFLVK